MEITVLSSKGQIIIPKALRDSHHWRPGTRFVIEDTPTGLLLKPASLFPATTVHEGVGCTGYTGGTKTVEEMNEGISEALRQEWGKGDRP